MVEVLQSSALWAPRLGSQFDWAVIDPPYAEHVHANAVSARSSGAGYVARDLGFAAVTDRLRETIAGYTAQVRRWSAVYTDLESAHLWREACTRAGARYVRSVPWVRWSQPQKSGDRPCTGSELVLLFHAPLGRGAPRMRWNGPGSMIALQHKALRAPRSGDPKHPTEKPLDQALDLVSWFSDPGEAGLDCCGGFATTGLAAALLDRDCLVLERSAEWARRGAARVAALPELGAVDAERVRRWVEVTCEDASRTPFPTKPFMRKTWERSQRRLADVPRVTANLSEEETET